MTAFYIFSSFTCEKSTAVLLKKREFPKEDPDLSRQAKYAVLLQSKCYYLGAVPCSFAPSLLAECFLLGKPMRMLPFFKMRGSPQSSGH